MMISNRQSLGLVIGPVLALVVWLFFDLEPGNPAVTRTAAVAILMAVWWVTEAIPIAVTAMIPVALFPLLGILNGKVVAGEYFNNVIFLFVGGFIMALAMQKWNLHKRIALRIMLIVGTSPRRIILGFMLATALLSMWISNTATTMMMVPIGVAVISHLKESDGDATRRFAVGLFIGIAYAASIGGIATLIGTPPNLALIRIYDMSFPQASEIGFGQWMFFGIPFSALFLAIAWIVLMRIHAKENGMAKPGHELFREELRKLGRISYEERIVALLFAAMALLWIFRKNIAVGEIIIPGWSQLFPQAGFIDDGTVAIAVGILLFMIPSKQVPGGKLMDWKTAVTLNWGIVILFGGGFALAAGFKETGLSLWVTNHLRGLQGVPPLAIVALVCTLLTFLTELTSNTATTQIVLPLLASLAPAIGVHPLLLMIPATLSASCAFMLPVATPPNAIVFGSGEVQMSDMLKTGIILNLLGVVLVTGMMFLLGTKVFGIG